MARSIRRPLAGLIVALASARADDAAPAPAPQERPSARAATTTMTPDEAEHKVQKDVRHDLKTQAEKDAEAERGHEAPKDAWALAQGESCEGSEVMWGACPDLPICEDKHCNPIDCTMKAWSDWSSGDCTGLCERQRNVREPNNQCGEPCKGALIETKNTSKCLTCGHPKKVDCEWGHWSGWTACSCSCGGGQKVRHRDVVVFPKAGGDLCDDKVSQEISPCNTQTCNSLCVDGEWGDWQDWSPCSHSCGGGTRLRSRQILTEADECGSPATGRSQEFEACNVHTSCQEDRDCEFGDWTVWSACSCSCNGVMRRSRPITVYGRGDGKWCAGSTKEISPCNPTPGEDDLPKGCEIPEPVDCELSDWEKWSKCTATCGGGQRSRRREIKTEAKGTGAPCDANLMEVDGCNDQTCDDKMPLDCEWGQWSDWGACDKCGGEKRRYRHIKQMPRLGGEACGYQASEEFTACPRHCHERVYCAWQEWADWDECTASCGSGTRMRERKLELTAEKPMEVKYEELRMHTDRLEANRMQDVLTAFAAGSVSFVLVMASARALRMGRRTSPEQAYDRVDTGAGAELLRSE